MRIDVECYVDSNIMWRRLTIAIDYLIITVLLNSSTPHNNRIPTDPLASQVALYPFPIPIPYLF